MKRFLNLMLVVAGLVVGARNASATFYTTEVFDFLASQATPTNYPISGSFTLPKFDTSLGTLVSVQLDFLEGATYSLQFTTTTGSSATFSAIHIGPTTIPVSIGVNLAITGPDAPGGIFNGSASLTTLSSTTDVTNTSITVPGNSSSSTYGATNLENTGTMFINSAAFSSWQGPGNVSLNIAGDTTFIASQSGGAFQINGSATGYGSVGVIYGYTESAPEPATMGLMGSALLAGAVFFRKRMKK